jgi:hypothetical protein
MKQSSLPDSSSIHGKEGIILNNGPMGWQAADWRGAGGCISSTLSGPAVLLSELKFSEKITFCQFLCQHLYLKQLYHTLALMMDTSKSSLILLK